MHDLPGAVFRSEDRRNPQIEWCDILSPADLAHVALYPHDVGELSSHVLRHDLEVGDLAIPEIRCGTLHRGSDLLPSERGRSDGVSEGHVFPVREHRLHGFGVALDELTQCELILFDDFVEIGYRGHPQITSTVGTCCSLKGTPH